MKNVTFINAGAGSGKTYRLTTDLARKLTQEGIEPSEVILTTYTELAAAEFREKARKEILNAKDKNEKLVEASIRVKKATQLDNAYIGTVHAISFRFIRKYWYLLNYGADIQPMSDQNQDFYMSQSISNIATDEDREVFRKFRDTFDIKPNHLFWLPELKNIVDKMEYYDIKEVKDSVEKSMEVAEKIFTGMPFNKAFEEINAFLATYKTYLDGLNSNTALNYKDTLEQLNYQLTRPEDLQAKGLKDCLVKQIGTARQKAEFYGTEYNSALNAYNKINVSKDYLPIIKSYLETIFNLAIRWQKALQTYKQENHIISFDDMEKIFLTMLTEDKYKEVQDDIKDNFKLLMVDEFQDSNPIQLKIFNRISELIAENGGHSIWVGDPKQAIYGFRGSDSRFISEILKKFKFSEDGKAIPEQGPDMLGTDQLGESWRSRPELVEFSNNIFRKPFMDSGLKETQIKLKPHYDQNADTLGKEKALYVWHNEESNADKRANALANQIKALLDSKCKVHHKECDKPTSEITYRDIAVLCFKNSECNKVASALRKIGLPASCEEPKLMQCMEVYLLKTLLLFVQNPSDKIVRAELAMMLGDATTEDILKDRIQYVNEHYKKDVKGWDKWMDSDSKYSDEIAKLSGLTKRYKNLSIYDTVVAIHEELDLDNIVEKWGDVTQRKHNLSTVVNMAKAYDDMCQQMGISSSILGFINYLTITKPDNKTDNSANTIKVLTYHRSKGLEWPIVILDELDNNFNDEHAVAEKKFRGVNVCEVEDQETDIFNRNHYISLFPQNIGGLCNSKDQHLPDLIQKAITQVPLFDDIKKQNSEEALRLLYVGVTRAKDILISMTTNNPCNWLDSLGIDYIYTIKDSAELEEPTETDSNPQYKQSTNKPGINDAKLLYLSPSTIDTFEDSFTKNEQVAESEERLIEMGMFPKDLSDAEKGTCIHNIFAVYKPGEDESNMRCITQTLSNFGVYDASKEHKEQILQSIKWLYDYLTKAYGPATRIEHECPLLYKLASGQVLRGEIDLQWYYDDKDGQNKCVLLDYKTFPGKRSALEEHTKKYYSQLSAYHAALTAAGVSVSDTLIYYPTQGHVRKLL